MSHAFYRWPVTSMGFRTVGTNRMGPGVRSLSRFAEARFKGLNLGVFEKGTRKHCNMEKLKIYFVHLFP